MDSQSPILTELRELESTLAPLKISGTQAYSVPTGYFEQLASRMLELIQSNPDTYSFNRTNPYNVPQNYFNELPETMLNIVKAQSNESVDDELETLSPLLAGIDRKMPFAVPQGFFASKESSAQIELNELSALLASLEKKNPYKIPQGYFEDLSLPSSVQYTPARVVSMGSRKWLRYGVAAAMIGIIASVSVLSLKQGSQVDASNDPYAWVEKNMKKVDNRDISNFIQLTDETVTPEKEVIASTQPSDEVKRLMKDVSEKDIQDFLSDIPADQPDDSGADDDVLF